MFPSPEWDKVSEDAQRFISQLLRKNPKERITIKKALKNKWLVSRADNIVQDKRIGKAALQNLA